MPNKFGKEPIQSFNIIIIGMKYIRDSDILARESKAYRNIFQNRSCSKSQILNNIKIYFNIP